MSKNPFDEIDKKSVKPEKEDKEINAENVSVDDLKKAIKKDVFNVFKKSDGSNKSFNDVVSNFIGNPNSFGRPFFVFLFSLFLTIGLLSGFYIVRPQEQGVILRLGKYVRTADSGLNYHIPFGIERVIKEDVTRVRVIQLGNNISDSLMLTGDENIVDVQFQIQWKVEDLNNYLFNVKNNQNTIANVSQSVIREIIGTTPLVSILTDGRNKIENDALLLIREILNKYKMGIDILLVQILKADPPNQVIDAFREVQDARVDKESIINMADAYREDVVPKSKGKASVVITNAKSDAIARVKKSEGEVNRFNSIYDKYKNAKYVTRKRMYFEAMEEITSNMEKIMIDSSVKNVNIFSSEDGFIAKKQEFGSAKQNNE